ncbi:sugar ABC transporter ATP-binding protein [Burkholderia alba]|uniref:sugar ABC transporter ATP-binding protein n=1 Tax=Burkholderia alba TaxID=2683677 RepID=UPI002B0567A9|nr:sugar ABC transporter ATP-binding protein [Burkholderia alba]
MTPVLLEASQVAKRFNGVSALRDGRLTLSAGRVHALCGGNGTGKSTFLNILMGLLRRDEGTIRLQGREVDFASPADALAHRMAIITQELSPVPGMSVAENLYLGREPTLARVVVDFRALRRRAQDLLDRLGFAIDAGAPMHRLSLAQTQLVEIAKAFSHDCQVMIMDEPTSAIGERETETLFAAIRNVTAQGAGIIYVSHRLSELFDIADDYTVFRNGAYVESGRIADIDRAHLVRTIVGREMPVVDKACRPADGAPCLSVRNLTRAGEFDDISLDVRRGEILGIYGLMGSGRSEFLNCVYGLTRPASGALTLNGAPLPPGDPARAIRAGISLVTEDRKASGLVLSGSVQDNIAMSAYGRLSRAGVIRRARVRRLAESMAERLRIKAASLRMPVAAMSGGNQQKVVLAKCLSTDPVLLLCDEPTRGIDEGAKQEIYRLLDAFARDGGAVIVVSSEAPELLYVSDRIAVFKGGRIAAVCAGDEATQETLLHLAS